MTMRKKLVSLFTIFAIVAGLIICIIYSVLSSINFRDSLYEQMEEKTSAVSRQMETVILESKSACILLLSDEEVLQAMRDLSSNLDSDESYENRYFSDSYTTIRNAINTYFIHITFNRMIYFNQNGDVIAGNNTTNRTVDSDVSYEDLEWLDMVDEGELQLIPVHKDDWGSGEQVLSAVYGLAGENLGYLEIQWLESDLREMFGEEEQDEMLFLYDLDGNVLYSQGGGEESGEIPFFDYVQDGDYEDLTKYLPGEGILFAAQTDADNGYVVVTVRQIKLIAQIVRQVLPVLMLVIGLFGFFTLAFIRFTERQVVEPIAGLRESIEKTELSDLSRGNFQFEKNDSSLEEVVSLQHSFENLYNRLSLTLRKDKELDYLQMQAQFDLLQAQVNPHFINNTLNVISARGLMDDDEVICEICSCLSRMLQYSTDTRRRNATIREETDYLQMYFSMMKYRYEDRLEYNVKVPAEIQNEVMPKVILQQIAENSIYHAYSNRAGKMRITVQGKGRAGNWEIHIRDEGDGFTPEKLSEIKERCKTAREQIRGAKRETVEMGIGGMGIVSVYARLYLVYGEELIFTIASEPGKGCDVKIGRCEGESHV